MSSFLNHSQRKTLRKMITSFESKLEYSQGGAKQRVLEELSLLRHIKQIDDTVSKNEQSAIISI